MNNKKKLIKLWSYILIATIIVNIIFFAFIIDSVDFEDLWVVEIIAHLLIIWNTCAFVLWLMSFFNIKYKKLRIENNEIEIYAGYINHYILVNGELKDEYKSSISFSPINLSCTIGEHKISVVISTSNHITVKCDDELIN